MNTLTRNIIHPNATVEFDDKVLTSKDFIELIDQWHSVFDALDLKSGDAYLTFGYLSIESSALLIAGAERGLIFTTYQDLSKANQEAGKDKKIKAIFGRLNEPGLSRPHPTDVDYDINIVHDYPPSQKVVITVTPQSALIHSTTSGTTGEPKSFTHTHHSFLAFARNHTTLLYNQTDRVACVGSILHIAILGIQLLPILMTGARCVLFRNSESALLNKDNHAKFNKITVPQGTTLDLMKDNPEWEELDFSFIDSFATGGVTLNEDLMVKPLLSKGVKEIVSLYGCSEAGIVAYLRITANYPPYFFSKEGYPLIGEFFPNVEASINEEGLLRIKSESIAQGVELDDGYFTPYDLIEVIDNRRYIKGRFNRSARINDVMVDLTSLEFNLKQYHVGTGPLIRDCFCKADQNELVIALDLYDPNKKALIEKWALEHYLSEFAWTKIKIKSIFYTKPTIQPGGIKAVWKLDD